MRWPWSKEKKCKNESAVSIHFIEYPDFMIEVTVRSEESYNRLLELAEKTAFEIIDKRRKRNEV